MKTIDTLIADIQGIFINGATITPEEEKAFGEKISSTICSRIRDYGKERDGHLRLSSLGKPDRETWYRVHAQEKSEALSPEVLLKFMYGDILEDLILFMAELSGHSVTHQQEEVTCGGIVGHIDAVIDGCLVDVKSASVYGLKKFKDGSIVFDDPFGYIPQQSAYRQSPELRNVVTDPSVYFLAIGKEHGDLVLCEVEEEDLIDAEAKAKHQRAIVSGELPERCYSDVEDGKGGNRTLCTKCNYCPFKGTCWSDSNGGSGLRGFKYSNGVKWLTHVEKLPKVEEVI